MVLNSIISLILINQAPGHPKSVFQGPDRQNFCLSTPPPPPNRCRKWVFSPREPGRALQVPIPPILGVRNSIMSLILINQAPGHPKMRFSGSRPTEFPFIHPPPPQRCRKWVFSPREPGRALQVPTPPILGVLNSIMSLILINQAPGHPKMRFSGSRPTEFPFIHPPPPQRCRKWVFSPREPGRALQVPIPPILGVLNSIMSLILINQAPGHPKMRFSGSRPTEFPFIHPPPPQTVPKMGFFTS